MVKLDESINKLAALFDLAKFFAIRGQFDKASEYTQDALDLLAEKKVTHAEADKLRS
jgi:hypothetical protein